MVGSIGRRCETARGTHWPKKVAWLFGARVAETILASGPKSPHQQAGHMDASDPIKPSKKLLWHGGRPHMGPCFRRDDDDDCLVLLIQLSSPGLTGRSSTPRPLDGSQAPLEYWVAPSSRAMTSESVARSNSSNTPSRSRGVNCPSCA